MQHVEVGQRWTRDRGTVHAVESIDGALATIRPVGPPTAGSVPTPSRIPVASLAAGDGGWRKMPSLAELMEEHQITELAARRVLRGESVPEAKRAAHYFAAADWPDELVEHDHWLDVYFEYAATLAPNPGAISYIVDETRNRIAKDAHTVALPSDEELLASPAIQSVVREFREVLGPVYDQLAAKESPVADTIANLNEVRKAMDTLVPPLVREMAQLYPKISQLLQAAAGHLDETNGPRFDVWRCDDCGNVLQEDFNDRIWDTRVLRFLKVQINAIDGGLRMQPICLNHDGEDGREMRHVRCRVTADVPASDPVRA